MDTTLADNINDIIFIVNIVGGVTTILSIGIDILNRLSIHQQTIKTTDVKTNIAYRKTMTLNWTKPVFLLSFTFFILTGLTLLFSSIDFYRVMSVTTFIILFSIGIFLNLIRTGILKATCNLEVFIEDQNKRMEEAKNEIEKANQFIKDNEANIQRSTIATKIFMNSNFK